MAGIKMGICRKCHTPYEIYTLWHGRSHICKPCRDKIYEMKGMKFRENSLGLTGALSEKEEVLNAAC